MLLVMATRQNKPPSVEALIMAGEEVNRRNNFGETITLDVAARLGKVDIFKALLRHGALADAVDRPAVQRYTTRRGPQKLI